MLVPGQSRRSSSHGDEVRSRVPDVWVCRFLMLVVFSRLCSVMFLPRYLDARYYKDGDSDINSNVSDDSDDRTDLA
jgi:hypothetical protein